MEAATLGLEALKGLVTIGVAFGATYATLIRGLQKKVSDASATLDPKLIDHVNDKVEKLRQDHGELRELVVDHCARDEALQKAVDRNEENVRRLDDRVARTVTDDEFATYVNANNAQLQNLIEKAGHLAGTIEAWAKDR